jgi:general secretion pathway protein F
MPRFRYEAVDSAGEMQKEEMEATSQEAAINQLRDQGLLPIAVEPAAGGASPLRLMLPSVGKRRKVSQDEVGVITQQIAKLLSAGLPLDRALTIVIGITEEGEVHKLLTRIQDQVRGGSSLADALEAQGDVFSRLYINMVRAGEAGGSLEVVLNRLNDFIERSKALKETVKSALIYPVILLVVAGLSVIILLTFVVPQFQQLFEDAGEALPVSTQIVIGLGDLVRSYWWGGLGLVLLVTVFMRQQLSQSESRYRWDRFVLRLPLVGDLVAKVEMARFSRTLGTLLRNGVSLLPALAIVKETLTNQVMAAAVNEVADNLKAGEGLAEPLMAAGVFPKLAVHMIKVGEETGQLEDMMLQVADTYDGEVQATVKHVLSLLEPALILGLGVIIAGIIMSILVAILGLNNLAF